MRLGSTQIDSGDLRSLKKNKIWPIFQRNFQLVLILFYFIFLMIRCDPSQSGLLRPGLLDMRESQPPPQALRFSQGRGERLVMNRKGPWEGYRRQAKRRLARCLLPAFLCAHIFIERETSGYEAAWNPCNLVLFNNIMYGFHFMKLFPLLSALFFRKSSAEAC